MGPEDYCEECGHHENCHLAGGCTAIVMPDEDDGTWGEPCGCMDYENGGRRMSVAYNKHITLAYLRKKYPHPLRGIHSRCGDDEYCVGGALCLEVGMDKTFPSWEGVRDAVERATGINHYALTDEDNELFRERCERVVLSNDAGNFERAWKHLETLLLWNPRDRFTE